MEIGSFVVASWTRVRKGCGRQDSRGVWNAGMAEGSNRSEGSVIGPGGASWRIRRKAWRQVDGDERIRVR